LGGNWEKYAGASHVLRVEIAIERMNVMAKVNSSFIPLITGVFIYNIGRGYGEKTFPSRNHDAHPW
jgi:hypothetical protein